MAIFALMTPASLFSQETKKPEDDPEKIERQKQLDRLFKMSLEELLDIRINSAGKISQMIRDIPASVVLITRDNIETYGYQTLTEILENVPGLFGIDDYAEFGTNFGIRGFWSGEANKNMIIQINGIPQVNNNFSNYPLNKILIPVEAIDRIEIIRGPMSVVYGNGAFYGVINIITNEQIEQSDRPVNMLSGSVGSSKTKKLFARVSGRDRDFSYSFNASIYDTYGIDKPLSDMMKDPSILGSFGLPLTSHTGGRLENNEKYFNFSGKLKEFFLEVNFNEAKRDFYFALPPVDKGSLDKSYSTHLSFGYRGSLSKKMDIEAKLQYSRNRDFYQYDHLRVGFYGVQEIETNAWEIELNNFFSPSRKMNIVTGLSYRTILDASNMFDLPSFGNPFFENNRIFLTDDDDIVTRAIFTQIDFIPTKRIKFVAGIRFEQSPPYKLQKIQSIGTSTIITPPAKFDKSEIEIIPRLAAIYYFNKNNVLKFLYGQAINRPSFPQNYQNTLLASRPDLDPESIQTYELNYIATFSSRFSINTSIFRNSLEKLITRVVKFHENKEYESYSANAGKMITNGIELTINAEPIEYLRMELSATYQNTKDNQPEADNSDSPDIEKRGNDAAYSPKFLGYIKANYLAVGFKIAITGTYVGAMESYWDPTFKNEKGTLGGHIGDRVNGYFLLGANLRFDDLFKNGLFLNIRCANLLNTEIRYPTFTNNDYLTRGTIGMGRMFTVSVGYKF